MIKTYLPLCGLHYHQCVSGKCPEVILKENFGIAKFNSKTQKIDYPSAVPKARFPLPASARPRKGLVFCSPKFCGEEVQSEVQSIAVPPDNATPDKATLENAGESVLGPLNCGETKCLAFKPSNTASTFYVDSGAGQSLSSCSTAFHSLEPCHIEVIGVAGSLTIFGIGTAVFALTLEGGKEILIRIHNCLYSFGEFNLLSVSQMQTILSSVLDLFLRSPSIRLYATDEKGQNRKNAKFVDIPLVMDDGLYALTMAPVSSDDPRHLTSQTFDITSAGEYFPLSQTPVSRQMKASRQM